MSQREDIYWNTFLPAFFARVSDIIKTRINEKLKESGLTYTHGMYVMALTLRDGQTLVGLAQFLDMDKSTTNQVIRVLREKNLVTDDRKSESSKKYKIYLTEEGKELGLKIMDFQIELMNGFMKDVTTEETLVVRNTLLKILKNMDPDLDNYMLCRYQDPFYTYLHVDMGEDLPYHVMNHLKEMKEDKSKDKESQDA